MLEIRQAYYILKGGNDMHTYGNNAIVAEYDYYTLDQARNILKTQERNRKRKNRQETISAIVFSVLVILICFSFFAYWLLIGY